MIQLYYIIIKSRVANLNGLVIKLELFSFIILMIKGSHDQLSHVVIDLLATYNLYYNT